MLYMVTFTYTPNVSIYTIHGSYGNNLVGWQWSTDHPPEVTICQETAKPLVPVDLSRTSARVVPPVALLPLPNPPVFPNSLPPMSPKSRPWMVVFHIEVCLGQSGRKWVVKNGRACEALCHHSIGNRCQATRGIDQENLGSIAIWVWVKTYYYQF